jgi:hypothetical protein
MKFAVAVLLGFVSKTEAIKFRPDPVQSPWAAKSSPSPSTKISGGFGPHMAGNADYTRTVPALYQEEKDDRLMNSLIQNYATEGNTAGQPNGKFYLTKADAINVADEVARTHLQLSG